MIELCIQRWQPASSGTGSVLARWALPFLGDRFEWRRTGGQSRIEWLMTCMESPFHVLNKHEMYTAGLNPSCPSKLRQVWLVSGGMLSRHVSWHVSSSGYRNFLIRS